MSTFDKACIEILDYVQKAFKGKGEVNNHTLNDILNKKIPDLDISIVPQYIEWLRNRGYCKVGFNYPNQTYIEVLSDGYKYYDDKSSEDKNRQKESNYHPTEQEKIWTDIEKQFHTTKVKFGKQINFIVDAHKREIIFRDIAHAFGCYQNCFYKPAVILAGAVMEELTRCYLLSKGVNLNTLPKEDFFNYINKCKQEGFLKDACAKLSDARRDFRNLVHIEKEASKRDTISSTNALGTITDIFTVANDFH
jgi:hypothetical protein